MAQSQARNLRHLNYQAFPKLDAPLTDPSTGIIDPSWHRLFITMWQKLGGSFSSLPNSVFLQQRPVGAGAPVTVVNAITGAVIPSAITPAGPAGGDLAGTYPNPQVARSSVLTFVARNIQANGNINATGGIVAVGDIGGVNGVFIGDVTAVNAIFSGNATAVNGVFSGNVAGVGGAFSGNITAVDGAFSGNTTAVNGTFSGNVSGVNGIFSGNVTAVDGTFSGDVTAVNGTFNGTLEVDPSIGGNAAITAPGGGYTYLSRVNTVVSRVSDRLFVGQDAAINDGSMAPTDWLANLLNLTFLSTFAQLEVLSTSGTIGIVGAARSSDATPPSASIGVTGIGINDVVGASSAWGGYFETRRSAGNTGVSQGIEVDAANLGATPVDVTPWVFPTGATIGVLAAAGANITPPSASSAGVVFNNNTQVWRRGIVFLNNALDAALGDGGNGIAVELARGQTIQWLNSGATVDAELWGSAEGLEVGPHGIVLSAVAAPPTPAAGKFVIYMDIADNTLKAKGPGGTVTSLALP